MRFVGIQEFREQSAALLKAVRRQGEIVVLTDHGRPCGVVLPVRSKAELEDLVLAHHPEFQRAWDEARKEIASGDYTTLEELRARAKE